MLGGPSVLSSHVFTTGDPLVAAVDAASGLLRGAGLGDTWLNVGVRAADAAGASAEFDEDRVHVRVARLEVGAGRGGRAGGGVGSGGEGGSAGGAP